MQFSRISRVLLACFIFMLVGVITAVLTHEPIINSPEIILAELVNSTENVDPAVYQRYSSQIRPWLQLVIDNYSPELVRNIRDRLLDFQASDQSLARVHINLFLAFEAWDQFINTENQDFKNKAQDQFTTVAELLPDLSGEINNLQNILN